MCGCTSAVAEAWGRVVALQANFCEVDLDSPPAPGAGQRLLCTRRSRLGHEGLQVWVGDRVRLEGIDSLAGRAVVAALEPRRNLLQRPAVANVNQVLVVASLAEPALDPLQLTRFLITAEATGAAVELVLGKADLLEEASLRAWCERLGGWGYPLWPVSTRSGQGLEALGRRLAEAGGISVLCGPSGAGKSSLLNALCPRLGLRVAEVSGRLRRGRHTTRHVELFPLEGGGLVADTPGFNRPELPDHPGALADAFPELRSRLASGNCRFRNCRHVGDPGCAMGTDWPRYPLYGQCLAEIEEQASLPPRRRRSGGEPLSPQTRGD
jgi:ribosome biogenesis GTPase